MSKKKVFFHYEARGQETYTKSMFLHEKGPCSVAEVIVAFTKSFQIDHPDVSLGKLEVTDSSGNSFSPDDDLYDMLSSKDDCYVVANKGKKGLGADRSCQESAPSNTTDATLVASSATVSLSQSQSAARMPVVVQAPPKPQSDVDYAAMMSSVHSFMQQKSLRKAKDICLRIIAHNDYHTDIHALERLCTISAMCDQHKEAVRYGTQILEGFATAKEGLRNGESMSVVLRFLKVVVLLSRSLSEIGEEDEALERLMQGLSLLSGYIGSKSHPSSYSLSGVNGSIFSSLSSRFLASKETIESLVLGSLVMVQVTISKGMSVELKEQLKELAGLELDLKADLTSALFACDRVAEAGALVNSLIGHPSSDGHMMSLLVYAEIAAAYNKIQEAVQAGLKAIVLDSTNRDNGTGGNQLSMNRGGHKRVQALMCRLLGSTEGLHEVFRQVPPTPQASAAYSFLAGVAKDGSQLEAAESILRLVVKLDANKAATHFLGLVHVLEGRLDMKGALSCVVLGVGAQARGSQGKEEFFSGWSVAQWCNELNEQLSKSVDGASTGVGQLDTDTQGSYVDFIRGSQRDGTGGGASVMTGGKATSGTVQDDGDYAVIVDTAGETKPEASTKCAHDYSGNKLDVLALAFTAVKLLFLLGRLGPLPRLIGHIEKARRSSRRPLHETNVRNEHAYYLCIVQIMACYTAPNLAAPVVPSSDLCHEVFSPFSSANITLQAQLQQTKTNSVNVAPIYMVGDSHILSSAFATVIPTANSPRLLIPKLITGLKQWHLREDSTFYTKEIFKRTMASIPSNAGAEVVFVIGEIDCREGILVAVERGVYASVLEGIRATLRVFREVVKDLIRKKGLKVYLHPVLPVLDVTRAVVLLFNQEYRKAMRDVGGCFWLDMETFFTQPLICSDMGRPAASAAKNDSVLRPELRLDGTHVHPRYVALLQKALSRHYES